MGHDHGGRQRALREMLPGSPNPLEAAAPSRRHHKTGGENNMMKETKFEKDKIRPACQEYRIVIDDSYPAEHPFDLEGKVNGKWMIVHYWNPGHDDYGQLHPPRWDRLGGRCAWTQEDLERYSNRLLQHLGYRRAERKVLMTLTGEEKERQVYQTREADHVG